MAKITRKTQTIFGNAGSTANFGKFGSRAEGSPVNTKDVETIQTLDAWDNGWQDAVLGVNKAPFLEDMNAIFYVHSYQTAYILQEGVPEWDDGTSYYIGSIVKKTATGELYVSLTDDNLNNALPNQTDNANWRYLNPSPVSTKNVGFFYGMVNGTIVASRAGNAETIAIKTAAGADPSANDPVYVVFRNVSADTGTYSLHSITAAMSITISSGSTLGMTDGVPTRLWLGIFNDGGTLRLGVINTQGSTGIFPLRDDQIYSSTAEGGAGAANSSWVIYTGTAVANKAWRTLGYLEYTLATAGTWNAAPSKIQLFGQGVQQPGETIRSVVFSTTTFSAINTTMLPDDTIPQNTEGTQVLTGTITPLSAANRLEIGVEVHGGCTPSNIATSALFKDDIADAIQAAVSDLGISASGFVYSHERQAGSTNAQTYRVRVGTGGAGTFYLNGYGHIGGRVFGGINTSYLRIKEIMA